MQGVIFLALLIGAAFALPEFFDARQEWPMCPFEVLNQARCGSCWAFATSEVLADRICILTNGTYNVTFSPQYSVSCDTYQMACDGGDPPKAWHFYRHRGAFVCTNGCTGGCVPYTSSVCTEGGDPYADGCQECPEQCADTGYPLAPIESRYHAHDDGYTFSGEAMMMIELAANGPLVISVDDYQIFHDYWRANATYIYNNTGNSTQVGGHAMKIIGWGVDEASGMKYWLVQNSWGRTGWNGTGTFRMLRGANLVNCETNVTTVCAHANSTKIVNQCVPQVPLSERVEVGDESPRQMGAFIDIEDPSSLNNIAEMYTVCIEELSRRGKSAQNVRLGSVRAKSVAGLLLEMKLMNNGNSPLGTCNVIHTLENTMELVSLKLTH